MSCCLRPSLRLSLRLSLSLWQCTQSVAFSFLFDALPWLRPENSALTPSLSRVYRSVHVSIVLLWLLVWIAGLFVSTFSSSNVVFVALSLRYHSATLKDTTGAHTRRQHSTRFEMWRQDEGRRDENLKSKRIGKSIHLEFVFIIWLKLCMLFMFICHILNRLYFNKHIWTVVSSEIKPYHTSY